LHLTKGGNTQGGLTTDKGSRRKEMLIDNVAFAGEYLARVKNSPHRLLYTTPILSEGLHISGTASITLSLSSSVPAANLSVWLVSLPWNDQDEATIYDNIITRGWADPQNHESIYTSQPLEPGVFYDLTFELQPDDQIIPAGQQIGLMIFSSDQEFTLHPKPGTELKIDLKSSSLTLPIVGGLSEFENAVK
jgi:X-Pro dipeptidyl-peptidase